jgi:hypothetical protein
MDPKQLLMALIWLAALGGVILVATRVVGKVGARAASAL